MAIPGSQSRPSNPTQIMEALASPFDPQEIRHKPGVVSGNRALAIPYVDARAIQDRLDEVLGLINWQDEYECMADGSVICRLRIRVGDEWICKVDVGGPSEQPDEGDRRKAAFSDALKRAAVKFGIGRYLYRQPPQWQDWDPSRKQWVRSPSASSGTQPARRESSSLSPPTSFRGQGDSRAASGADSRRQSPALNGAHP